MTAGSVPPPVATGETHARQAPRVGGRRLLAALALAAALAVLFVLACRWLALAFAPAWAAAGGLVVLQVAAVYLAVIVALIVAMGGTAGLSYRLAVRTPAGRDLARGGLALAAAITACTVIYVLLGLINGGIGATLTSLIAAGSDLSRLPTATASILALILVRVVLLAGVAEELLFRGLLYGWLRAHLTPAATIAITTALFAAEHAYYPILLPLVIALGLATGWVRHATGGTTVPITMHIATDLGLFAAAWGLA